MPLMFASVEFVIGTISDFSLTPVLMTNKNVLWTQVVVYTCVVYEVVLHHLIDDYLVKKVTQSDYML